MTAQKDVLSRLIRAIHREPVRFYQNLHFVLPIGNINTKEGA